ncbi:MAG: TonB family protein [Bacteroidota bacterium]|nr:TonB family protein [Bacteroidota bacterium]
MKSFDIFKCLLVLGISFLCADAVSAQTTGIAYYFKNSGKLVSSKDSADYSMVILPPDTSVDKNLYLVREYYKNGNIKLLATSKTNDVDLIFDGRYIAYFPDGKKMKVGGFENGQPVGQVVNYYHNGKLYSVLNYMPDGRLLYSDCRDSTGKILTEKGTGIWVQFNDNDNVTKVIAGGSVKNGLRDGNWQEIRDSITYKSIYKEGNSTSYHAFDVSGNEIPIPMSKIPEFPGGNRFFDTYLTRKVVYPEAAKRKGTQGNVLVSFFVETDGTIKDVEVLRGIGDGCDEEAVRLLKNSPKWSPAIKNNKIVRMNFKRSVPFKLPANN